jgi:hypothetical protein
MGVHDLERRYRRRELKGPTMTDYFLKIDGISGASRAGGFEGWFDLLGYHWEMDGSGNASIAGLPLVVQTMSLGGLPAVEKKAAAGSRLDRVELQAVTSNNNPGWYFKVVLAGALVTTSTLTGTDLTTTWSLGDYSRADVSGRSRDARGAWGPATTASWVR